MARDLVLSDIPWIPEGAPIVEDAIYSLLIESPSGVYISPGGKRCWLAIRGRGLICVTGDFSNMSYDDFKTVVSDIREQYDA